MTIEQVKSIQLVDYLQSIGYTPCKQQNNNIWYLSPLREEREPSFKVNLFRNEWYDFGAGIGGDIIRLVMELNHTTDVSETLRILSNQPTTTNSLSFCQQEHFESFEDITVKPLTNSALLQFLSERHIPADIASAYCKEVYYSHNSKRYFAVGFENDRGGFEIRNKYFKGCISPKEIIHLWNTNRSCNLFEGFMDFLSYQTLCRKNQKDSSLSDAIILNSVSNLHKTMKLLRNYEQVHGYLDNDSAGQHATLGLRKELGEKFIDHSPKYREYKDLNDYLCGKRLDNLQSNKLGNKITSNQDNKVTNNQDYEPTNEPPKPKRGFRL